jgi:hypothetical protein
MGKFIYINSYSQRFRYWAIHNDLIPNVVDIVRDKEKILDLQVVKFVKSIITNNDENLIKILISNNSFKKIIDLFEINQEQRNLVFSATLELFDIINKMTMKKIILHLVNMSYDLLFYYIIHFNNQLKISLTISAKLLNLIKIKNISKDL